MAASGKRLRASPGYYQQLNESGVWFLEPTKAKKGKRSVSQYYSVERLISKRENKESTEYLVKWEGYSLYNSSWEDKANLTSDLIRTYNKPHVDKSRLQGNIDNLLSNIITKLKGKSRSPVSFNFHHDCFRFLFGGKGRASRDGKAFMFEKDDFLDCNFFSNWDQCLDKNGDGVIIQFPIRIQLVLHWSSVVSVYRSNELVKQPRMPVEKLTIDFLRRPFSCVLV